ncbi:MAG: gliding motility protein GldL [Bacteroidales bacterium]|nr:gliding motility protein GldL [Bacteroidales bacterium]MCF8326977.1 gliding motility protein GldL [Bacteroidales bacterium]
MAKLYGWGAALVIGGALFKINHYPGAEIMLIIGMGTECVIFFFSAFEPEHVEPDWSLVYPELAGLYHPDEVNEEDIPKPAKPGQHSGRGGGQQVVDSTTQELDKMLEDAKIGPELIESLGQGLRSLSDNASKMTDLSNAAVATNNYVQNMEKASESVNEMSETYQKSTQLLEQSSEQLQKSLSAIDFSDVDTGKYKEEIKRVSENLASLNSAYEIQLKSTNEQAEANAKLKDNMEQFVNNLNDSAKQTEDYKQKAAELSDNVARLNKVYGNMLSAMNVQQG